VRARARLVVDGAMRVLESDPPLALRATPDGVFLVGAAASPVGGDDLALEIAVGPGSCCAVRTSAASVALPGGSGAKSRMTVNANVGCGGHLSWKPEPLIAAARCRHTAVAEIDLAPSATMVWRDEIVLGRYGEEAGACTVRSRVRRDGRPLLTHDIVLNEACASPSVLGDAGAVGMLLVVGPHGRSVPAAAPPVAGAETGVFAIDDDVVLITALGRDARAVRTALDTLDGNAANDHR
jgi:urease accessory protein